MTSMRERYGLSRPIDFGKALPLLVSVALLLVVLATAALLAAVGKLTPGTDRWSFFVYTGTVLLLSAGLAFAPRVAWFGVVLVVLEIGISVVTLLLGVAGFGQSLFPGNVAATVEQFVYHPLLQVVPRPDFAIVRDGKTVRHDRFGLRQTPSAGDGGAAQVVIAALGGSTTYSAALPQGSTWPDLLQERLGRGYRVLNFGVPGYSTAEHVIQTAFYLGKTGSMPRCALYYVGWNDIRNAHLPNLDPAYADFHLLSQVGNLASRREYPAVRASPLLTIVSRQAQKYLDSLPHPPDYRALAPVAGSDPRLEEIYRGNIRSIAAINGANGVKTLFIAQILNRAKLTGDAVYGWLPRVRDKDVWPLQSRFNDVLADEARKIRTPAIIPDIGAFEGADFVDNGHFSERGSRKFAGLIADRVAAECGR